MEVEGMHGGKPQADGEWSTDFFDCFSDDSNCCIAFWCPCVTFGQIAEIVDRGSSSCGTTGALYVVIAMLTGCACYYSCYYRTKMRRQYNLKGSECGDCLKHFFCEACALTQAYRELNNRGFDVALGWHGNVERRNGGVAMGAPVVEGGMMTDEYLCLDQSMEAQHLHAKPHAEGEWSTGFCDCFSDCKNCCITFWCPCITFGQVAEIVDRGSTTCGTAGALYALITAVTGCGCIYSCFYRGKMRAQYNIRGDECGDCLKHFCCELCALTQQYRELKHRGFDMSLGWAGNVERQQNQGGVAMGAPVFQGGMTR